MDLPEKINNELKSLKVILESSLKKIENIENHIRDENSEKATKAKPEKAPEKSQSIVSANSEFEELKDLLNSDLWPHAVPPDLICDVASEEDKMERAEGVLSIVLDQSLNGSKFLDFGCGEGHMALQAKKEGATVSVGYDIREQFWDRPSPTEEGVTLTTDFEKVKEQGPYDVILLYDVLDHVDDQELVLEQIKQASSAGTEIFIRTHPWAGRHASHLYKKINKAFVHLVFTEEELDEMGFELKEESKKPSNPALMPLFTYSNVFKNKFKIISHDIDRDPIEDFFKNNALVKSRIMNNFKNNNVGNFPDHQMGQSFIDYKLKIS